MTAATLTSPQNHAISTKPSLIDERMSLFLRRRLRDILAHLSPDKHPGRVRRTKKALKKLPTESYGTCESCGRTIDIGRLLVDPTAEICACCESGKNCPVGHPLHQN